MCECVSPTQCATSQTGTIQLKQLQQQRTPSHNHTCRVRAAYSPIVPQTPTNYSTPTTTTLLPSPHIRTHQMDMKTMGSFYYENFAFPGMVPYKRTAADKSGIPVYQPGATTYQQLMQLQQPFVPVSFTGHPPGVPRF